MYRIKSTPASNFRHFRRLHSRLTKNTLLSNTDQEKAYQILWRYQILDPDSDIVAHWNRVFLVTSLLALFIDPLYFYLPHVGGPACYTTDSNLGVWVTLLRSVFDLFYVLHITMKFRTAYVARDTKVFGRGDLVTDTRMIALRYLKSDFILDLAAALPLPQIFIWLVIPTSSDSRSDYTNNTLALYVLIQYVPRLFLLFPLQRHIRKTTGVVVKAAWTGAAYNLLLYLLASHVIGASWYLTSIGRQFACWKSECKKENNSHVLSCFREYLDCRSLESSERQYWQNVTRVISICDPKNVNAKFKFGIFADAFVNDVASAKFKERYFYCLWWGLRNLSSYAQNLDSSTYIGDNLFCIFLCIVGLILCAFLIGNMQTYLQSTSVRLEEWRLKKRDTEEWMRHRQLPPQLQERIRKFVQYKWLTTRGVNEETILHSFPLDIRREIQRHLCLSLVCRVPFFSQMDDQLLDAICERLISSLSIEGNYLFREGDLVNEMLFIIRGKLESSTTNGGRSGFFNSITLRSGDFCGEELLTWALMPSSSSNLPSSTRTVRALTEVEAFALHAEDLKLVASQFKRLHSKQLQDAFRYYSHQWRAWGACYLQTAWRRYAKRKAAKELIMRESFHELRLPDSGIPYINELAYEIYEDRRVERSGRDNVHNTQNLETTILASKFAANTRRGAHQKGGPSDPVPQLFKPDEADFFLD